MSTIEFINRMIYDATRNDTEMLHENMEKFIEHTGLKGKLMAYPTLYGDPNGGHWNVWQFVERE